MQEIPIKLYIKRLFLGAFLLFVANKFYLRPWVLRLEWDGIAEIFVFSVPNFAEAIMGTIAVTGILLQARRYFQWKVRETSLYTLATLAAGIYVVSQELKFHNLGGNNVYDPNDLMASLVGLVLTFALVNLYGFTEDPAVNN